MEAMPTRAIAGLAASRSIAAAAASLPWCRFGTRVAALLPFMNLFDQDFQWWQRSGLGHSVNPTFFLHQRITTLMLDLAMVTVKRLCP